MLVLVDLKINPTLRKLTFWKLTCNRRTEGRRNSEISIAGLLGFRFLLDSGLHVADAAIEAPLAAARDVDDAAPLVTAA